MSEIKTYPTGGAKKTTKAKVNNTRYHYWLLAAAITFNEDPDNAESKNQGRNVNALITTENKTFTRKDLATGQSAVLQRFVTEAYPEGVPVGLTILDTFSIGVSYLGQMTTAEFHAGFEEADQPEEPLHKLQS
jgi:hypothetical protein